MKNIIPTVVMVSALVIPGLATAKETKSNLHRAWVSLKVWDVVRSITPANPGEWICQIRKENWTYIITSHGKEISGKTWEEKSFYGFGEWETCDLAAKNLLSK